MCRGITRHQPLYVTSDGTTMIKENALIDAMVKAIIAPSDTESEEARQLTMEIARNMPIGEVLECQRKAFDIVSQLTEKPTTLH